jgi:4-azaleucine resistance transporter AzlC
MIAAAGLRDRTSIEDLRRGAVAMLPLCPGIIAFALAYATTASASGFTPFDTLVSSLLIFAGSAQFAMITLAAGGAGWFAILSTTLLLNLRHVLYALSLSPRLRDDDPTPHWLMAFFLTDEIYGLALRDAERSRVSTAFCLGAGLSTYACYVLATAAGAALGATIPDLGRLGLEFVFPLTFVALLVPTLRRVPALLVAAVAGGLMLALEPLLGGGAAILIATLSGATLGAALDRPRAPQP